MKLKKEAEVHDRHCSTAGARRGGAGEEETVLQRCLFIISLLMRFSVHHVRVGFQQGKLELPKHYKLSLAELDLLCSHLLPTWGSDEPVVGKFKVAQSDLSNLVNATTKRLDIGTPFIKSSRSFREWNSILLELASSDYWDDLLAPHHCNGFWSLITEVHPNKVKITRKLDVASNTNHIAVNTVGTDVVTETNRNEKSIRNENTTCQSTEHQNSNSSPSENGNMSIVAVNSGQSGIDVNVNKVKTSTSSIEQLSSAPTSMEIKTTTMLQTEDIIKENKVVNGRAITLCEWCGKIGHMQDNCWRKKGLCLICGGQHNMRLCARYIKPAQYSFAPRCPTCSGSHLGKDCSKINPSKLLSCNWCGKICHTEDLCWMRLGACLLCGECGHDLVKCFKFVSNVPIFPPWCTKCTGQHLGQDCESPYME